jgi:hypothetical protein
MRKLPGSMNVRRHTGSGVTYLYIPGAGMERRRKATNNFKIFFFLTEIQTKYLQNANQKIMKISSVVQSCHNVISFVFQKLFNNIFNVK